MIDSDNQLTLSRCIEALKKCKADSLHTLIDPQSLCSYRGYYEDLCLCRGDGSSPVNDVIEALEGAVGKTFTGYKGGEYRMKAHTAMWWAPYGSCGEPIVGFTESHDLIVPVIEQPSFAAVMPFGGKLPMELSCVTRGVA